MQWQTDWGLRGRMALTMFLLFALYIVFIGLLSLYFTNLAAIVLVMGLFMGAQFFFSDKLALYSMGAKEVSPEEYPDLHRKVERLAQQADLPKPKIAVADSRTPNAFATGRSQSNAAVAVTTGIMRMLDDDELEGVIAHELAHIKNRDVMVMTIASFLSTIAFLIVRWGLLPSSSSAGAGSLPADATAAASSRPPSSSPSSPRWSCGLSRSSSSERSLATASSPPTAAVRRLRVAPRRWRPR